MKKLCMLGILSFLPTLGAAQYDTEKKVAEYVHSTELERRHAWYAISQLNFKGNEHILDVGCGDGRNTAWMAYLVREGKVVGVDPSAAMIDWARKQYHRFEFPNLSFEKGEALQLPEGQFDLITSFYSLHKVKKRSTAVQSFYEQLKSGGKVLVILPADKSYNPEFDLALTEAMESLAWRHYFPKEDPSTRDSDVQDPLAPFFRAGFSQVIGEYIPSYDPFVNKDEFADWFTATWASIEYLPEGYRKPFAKEVAKRYTDLKPAALGQNGVIYGSWGHIEILAIK